MQDEPTGVRGLTTQQRLELALALLARDRRSKDGLEAFQRAYPQAADGMVHTAAFHVYGGGPDAVVSFLADAELFLREPTEHKMSVGVTWEVLYHLYNWLQFRELLPNGRQHVLDLLKQLTEFVAKQDMNAIQTTVKEIKEALGGSRDFPNFD